jgi:hypothetical protein
VVVAKCIRLHPRKHALLHASCRQRRREVYT